MKRLSILGLAVFLADRPSVAVDSLPREKGKPCWPLLGGISSSRCVFGAAASLGENTGPRVCRCWILSKIALPKAWASFSLEKLSPT